MKKLCLIDNKQFNARTGKTALIRRFVSDIYSTSYKPTVGCDFASTSTVVFINFLYIIIFIIEEKQKVVGNVVLTYALWEVGGDLEPHPMRSKLYRNTSVILLVFVRIFFFLHPHLL